MVRAQVRYEQEIVKADQAVEGQTDPEYQLANKLNGLIFGGKDQPRWIHIILNIGKIIAQVVALIRLIRKKA